MIEIEHNTVEWAYILPSIVQQVVRTPFEGIEWLFGVKDALYMNLIANTELVRSKSVSLADKTYFDFPQDKKTQKNKRVKPVHFLDLSNSS